MENKIISNYSSVFDEVADQYDGSFTSSLVGRAQRKRVYTFLKQSLKENSLRILEINCGTGEDATWFASNGNDIVATDASHKMIEITSKKIQHLHLESKASAKQVSFKELKDNFSPQSFDLVFSNFGGLNCISKEDLAALGSDVAGLLKPNGKFIAVIMGRKCSWERFYFLLKGKSSEAFRRNQKGAVKVKLGKAYQETWYYSPREIRKILSSNFQVKKVKPVGITIPPSYLNHFFENKRLLFRLLSGMEGLSSFSFLSNFGDHYFMELQKIN